MKTPSARELYLRHRSTIYRFLRNATGDATLAEDLTQDTFVRVLRGLETYEARDRDLAWLFRIARRLLLDHRRSVHRQPPMISSVDTEANPPNPGPLMVATLAEALQQLEESEREAFLLREQEGWVTRRSPRSRAARPTRCGIGSTVPGPLSAGSWPPR